MTYTQFKNELRRWLNTDEETFVAELDNITANAEKRIYNRVMVPDTRTSATASTVSGTKTVAVTGDILVPLRVWLTVSSVDRAPMIRKPVSYMREMFVGYASGEPTYYAWQKSSATQATFILGPTPNSSSYTLNVEFIDGTPPSFVSATTWLSTNYIDVLTKVALHEGSIFLKAWEQEQTYKKEAEEAINSLIAVVGAPPKDEQRPQ
jgi:hypothetical protein